MVRTRLVLLVTIAALLAPWVTPCLAAAPDGHAAMPCCRRAQPGTPVARPCCEPAGTNPAAPPSAAPSLLLAAQMPAVVAPVVSLARPQRLDTTLAAALPRALRLRSAVLLI